MSSKQTILPVIRPSRKTVLGGYNTGGFIDFEGTETTFTLASGLVIPIQKWFPDNTRSNKRDWFMAYIVDEANFRLEGYLAYEEFVPISAMNPVDIFQSPASMPGLHRRVKGTILEMMDSPNVHLPAVAATPSPVTGMALKVGVAFDSIVTVVNTDVASGGLQSGAIPAGIQLDLNGTGLRNFRWYGTPTTAGAINAVYRFNTTRGPLDVTFSGTVAP